MPDFKPTMKDYKQLTPFKFQILQSFPFIAEDFDSLTNYELLCKVVEYLNDVINNNYKVEDNVTALYNSFIELQDYVNNYFDNLDVQEEINNKLDEMAEDGSLYTIISLYTQPIVNEQNIKIKTIENKVNSLSSGSPLVASSIDGMTNTSRVYVNTTDGKWYYYNDNHWQIGGTYQATEDSISVVSNTQKTKLLFETNKIQKIEPFVVVENWKLNSNGQSEFNRDYNVLRYKISDLNDTSKILLLADQISDSIVFTDTANTQNVEINVIELIVTPTGGYVSVPEGATYLLISTLKTNTENGLYTFNLLDDIEIQVTNNINNIADIQDDVLYPDIESGTIQASTAEDAENNKRVRTGYINALKGTKIKLLDNTMQYTIYEFRANMKSEYTHNNNTITWYNSSSEYEVTDELVAYIRIVMRYKNDGVISNISQFKNKIRVDNVKNIDEFTKMYATPKIPTVEDFHTTTVPYDVHENMSYNDVIAGWDNLVTLYPNYVSKVYRGKDSSNNYDIYNYVFTPKALPRLNANAHGKNYSNENEFPIVILEAGVHGSEKPITKGLLNAMTMICSNWQDNEYLEYLRWNIKFVVNPIAVPNAYVNQRRVNDNHVNINRNFQGFDYWQYGSDDPTSDDYRGAYPQSEVESQYIDQMLQEFKDHTILYYSYHTYGVTTSYDKMTCFAFAPFVKTNEMWVTGSSLIKKITQNAWKYHNVPTNSNFIGIMQSNYGALYAGGQTCIRGNYYGIPSACPEGLYYIYPDNTTANSTDVNCLNAEYIIISIIEGLRNLLN